MGWDGERLIGDCFLDVGGVIGKGGLCARGWERDLARSLAFRRSVRCTSMVKILRSSLLLALACSVPVQAVVSVYVQDVGGVARLEYKCSAGEVVRSFALDVAVDRGRVVVVRDYFRGESTEAVQGYGIFPASLRDHVLVGGNPDIDWTLPAYAPLASVADSPADTLPGLGSAGVTLEFCGLWDTGVSAAKPGQQGVLCVLEITEPALVTVNSNASRGGVISAKPGDVITTVFAEALVTPIRISEVSVEEGTVTVYFSGGELQTASALDGEWTGTGDSDGDYTESIPDGETRFYRVFQGP